MSKRDIRVALTELSVVLVINSIAYMRYAFLGTNTIIGALNTSHETVSGGTIWKQARRVMGYGGFLVSLTLLVLVIMGAVGVYRDQVGQQWLYTVPWIQLSVTFAVYILYYLAMNGFQSVS